MTVEKPNRYHLKQVIKVNITNNRANWFKSFLYKNTEKDTNHFRGVLAKNAWMTWIQSERNIRFMKLRDILQSNQPVVFKTINVKKDKERPKVILFKGDYLNDN